MDPVEVARRSLPKEAQESSSKRKPQVRRLGDRADNRQAKFFERKASDVAMEQTALVRMISSSIAMAPYPIDLFVKSLDRSGSHCTPALLQAC
jgi:hypothetical protein